MKSRQESATAAATVSLFFNGIRMAAMGLSLLAWGSCAGGIPSGFVGLENQSGVWWFKSPEGKPFLSIGANHVEAVYWQSPNNNEFVRERYGGELFSGQGEFRDGTPAADAWARRVSENFKDWGFNTFGFHNPLFACLRSAGPYYYVVQLDIPVSWGWNMSRSELVRTFKNRPLDVFGDDFIATVETNAEELVKPRAADPMVLGYAYTDGPPWTVMDDQDRAKLEQLTQAQRTLHPWVLALMSLPAGAKGKQAWVAAMKERHPSAEKAGAVYGLKASAWEDLAAHTAWADITDPGQAAEDSQAFLEKIMRQWYEVRKSAIRRHDSNHLILGDKLNMNRDRKFPEQLERSLKAMGDCVDVVNIQYYAPFTEQKGTLEMLYKMSGKPILNGDTACLPLWQDNPVDNAEYYGKIGETYAQHLRSLFAVPYFIGWHHCGYMRGLRQPYAKALKSGNQKEIEFYQKSKHTYREGFVSEFEEPIVSLVTPMAKAVKDCESLHRDAGNSGKSP